MHPTPRKILIELIAEHGSSVSRDARRCEALLRDYCGQNRREVNVLLAAVRARVGADLMAAQAATPRAALLVRLTRRLIDDFCLTEEAAQWAVESWALALGIELPNETVRVASARNAPEPPIATDDLAHRLRSATNVQVVENPADHAVMLWIPPGEFRMGDEDQKDNPRHSVYLDGFWMYKTPVTVAQFMRFCTATGRAAPNPPSWGWHDDHPVVNVSWIDATDYAAWAGVRLPTEAQWEKAARGTDSRLYPWGNAWEPSRCAHSVGSARVGTLPRGAFPRGASPYGVLDMAGNVWEWCADWYEAGYLRTAPGRNPTGPPTGERRILRGGSWNDNMAYIYRTALRFRYEPGGRFISFGFRCAASPGDELRG